LRLLLVHDSLSDNGGVRVTLDLAERLARLGATAEVFALQPVRAGRDVAVPTGVLLTRGVPAGGRMRSSGPAAAARLLRACRRADVVVSGSEVGLGLLSGYAAARLARRPFVVVVHAPLDRVLEHWVPPALRRATRRVHRHADAAICVSAAVVAGVIANGLDPERADVVVNAVDVDAVRRLASAAPAPAPRAPVVVGLGRLSAEKGFDLLVRAHAELRRLGVEHELELIGEGPEREELLRLVAECGVADSTSLPGYVENALARVARASVLVIPSRHEGLPLVLLESLALGVPVIAARSAGAAELLPAEALVDDDSVPALVAALRGHLEHPERLRAASRGGAAAVRARTPDDAARQYLRILERTARRPGTPERAAAAYE
jgi:glycosyltransferase involved in cell wall biosynthesis